MQSYNPRGGRALFSLFAFLAVLAFAGLACTNGSEPGVPGQGGADEDGTTAKATPEPTPAEDAVTPTPEPTPDPRLLPNLEVSEPQQLYGQASAGGGREIRFSTTVNNLGEGAMEIRGEVNAQGEAIATQIIELRDGGTIEHDVGLMEYFSAHGHWHLQDFFIFELWTYDPDDGSLLELQTRTGKISFCMMDYVVADPEPETVAPAPEYLTCGWRVQGLSAGWGETYDAGIPGQELDITHVPDGRYAVRTMLDPDNKLVDQDETNKTSVSYIEISGYNVMRIDAPAQAQRR